MQHRKVDRGFVKAVAWKRTITGTLSVAGAIGMVALVLSRDGRSAGWALVAAAIFLVTGAWALRDGVRLLRALHQR